MLLGRGLISEGLSFLRIFLNVDHFFVLNLMGMPFVAQMLIYVIFGA